MPLDIFAELRTAQSEIEQLLNNTVPYFYRQIPTAIGWQRWLAVCAKSQLPSMTPRSAGEPAVPFQVKKSNRLVQMSRPAYERPGH